MADATKSPDLVGSTLAPYYGFKGIDRSRPVVGMDDGKGQALYTLNNGYTDFRGTIRRLPATRRDRLTDGKVRHIRFFSRLGAVWAEEDGKAVNLRGHYAPLQPAAFAKNSVVSTCVFRGKVHFMSSGFSMIKSDGYGWEANTSQTYPAFGVPILGRMYCAGFADEPTLIKACRVDNENVFTEEETGTGSNRAAFLDIGNTIGTGDFITGLGSFEINRLAIFTNDQTLVYQVDPDPALWQADYRASLQIGCISHNAITRVGKDLVWPSRHGIHALSRSDANGLAIADYTLSHEIEDLYKQLLRDCIGPEFVTAAYDQDMGHYYLFFPMEDGLHVRLSCNLKQGYDRLTWYTAFVCGERCGDFLAGTMLFGSNDGTYVRLDPITPISADDDLTDDVIRGELDICTPIHWHGSIDEYKESKALVLQATGSGALLITAYDEEGQEIYQDEVQIEGREDTAGDFPNVNLEQQYRLPFEVRYRGVQFQFRSVDNGDVRILGYAIDLRTGSRRRGR